MEKRAASWQLCRPAVIDLGNQRVWNTCLVSLLKHVSNSVSGRLKTAEMSLSKKAPVKIPFSPLKAPVSCAVGRGVNQRKLSLIQNASQCQLSTITDWVKVICFHSIFPTEERLSPLWRKTKSSEGSGCVTLNQQIRSMPRDRSTHLEIKKQNRQ